MTIKMKLMSMIGLVLICILSAIFITSNAHKDISFLNSIKNNTLELRNKWLTFTGVNKSLLITDVSEPVFQNLLEEQKNILLEITEKIRIINSETYLQQLDSELSEVHQNINFIWDLASDNINRTRILLDSDLIELIQKEGRYGSVIEIGDRFKALGATKGYLKIMELVNSVLAMSSVDDSFSNTLDKQITVINDRIAIQELRSEKTLLLASIFIILFAMMSLLLFGNQIVKNIKTVEHAVRGIASGDYSIRLNIKTHDEFRGLSDNFNLFFHELGRNIESIQGVLKTFGSAVSEKMQFTEILELIAERAFQDTNADGVGVLMLDDKNEYLNLKVSKGSFPSLYSIFQSDEFGGEPSDDSFRENKLKVTKSKFGEPVLTGKPIFLKDIKGFSGIRSIIMTPLIIEEQPIGVLILVGIKKESYLTDLDYAHIQTFTDFASLTIANFNSHQKMIVNLSQEIEERKQTERALHRSETNYKDLFELSPIGLALCKMDGQLVTVNSSYANIMGYNVDEVLKLTYWDITPKKYEANELYQLEKIQKSGCYGPYEKEYIHKDGHLVPVRLNGKVVMRDDEEFIWSSVEDITALNNAENEKHKLQDQLRQSQKMEAVGTLSGGIAHDFNNILSIILGYADLAKNDISDYSPAKNKIDEVIKAGNRAKDLVKQILSFSRKEASVRVPVKIDLILNEALNFLRATIPTTIDIKEDINTGCINILADATQIHQVIINLCTNAAQSMEEKGGILEVSLSCQELLESDLSNEQGINPGIFTVLSIKDSGQGIPPEIIDKIFDPYFTTKEVGKGSGMGLSTVIGIVKNHDGIITVDTAPGKGATFKVFFPCFKEEVVEHKNDSGPVPVPVLVGTERILIVEDDKSIANLTKELMENMGYQATVYTNSIEALDYFRSNPDSYDLVITDQTMPEMTGEQMSKELLGIRPNIPIIMCTGYSNNIDAEKANLVGIRAFILKPVNNKELVKTVRQVLDAS